MAAARARAGAPRIEVIDSVDFDAEGVDAGSAADGEIAAAPAAASSDNDMQAPLASGAGSGAAHSVPLAAAAALLGSAAAPAAPPVCLSRAPAGYGFNRRHAGVFTGALRDELAVGVLHSPDPEGLRPRARAAARVAAEAAAFDAERYAGDEACGEEDAIYATAVGARVWWAAGAGGSDPAGWAWTAEEEAELAGLPRVELLVDGEAVGGSGAAAAAVAARADVPRGAETARAAAGLAGLLFAYAYDFRTTGGEAGVETPWTLAALSPLLSWCDDALLPAGGDEAAPDEPLEALVPAALAAGVRRALTYPYLRRWDVAALCAGDAATLLLAGRRAVLRALLAMRRACAHAESDAEGHFYLLNTLFFDDFAVYAAGAPAGVFSAAGAAAAAAAAELALDAPRAKAAHPFADLGLLEIDAAVAAGRAGGSDDGASASSDE
jgi:hypothetical protein